MRLAQKIYPELNSYIFEIPDGYDYRALSENSMPTIRENQLLEKLRSLE